VVLLGGGDAITAANAADLRCSVVFPLHRDSLTLSGELALRDRAVMVVPHLLLSSAEELAAASLADPEYHRRVSSADSQSLPRLLDEFRSGLRHKMLVAWDQIQARAKEERSIATRAALSLAADRLLAQLSSTRSQSAAPQGAQ
jgi:transketolase